MMPAASRLALFSVLSLIVVAVGCVSGGRHTNGIALGGVKSVSVSLTDESQGESRAGRELAAEVASTGEEYHLICWNVHKAADERFEGELDILMAEVPDRDDVILCLQEARSTTFDLIRKPGREPVRGHYAESWRYPLAKRSTGVMTVSSLGGSEDDARRLRSRHREFLVTSPKVSLRSNFELNGDRQLVVLNCHGLNFVSDRHFRRQLDEAFGALGEEEIARREGDADVVIACGDFNVWSRSRLALLEEKVREAGLSEANVVGRSGRETAAWKRVLTPLFRFDPEIPLDRIYARGIEILGCRMVAGTESSDHAPVVLHFSVGD